MELGAFKGSSAVLLADAAYNRGSPLMLIDTFVYGSLEYGVNSAEEMCGNLARLNLPTWPKVVQGDSATVPDGVDKVGFLHIDTDHHKEHLYKELDAWQERVVPGGIIAFHDYCHNSPEMIPAINERMGKAPDWECVGLERWMIAFRKVPDAQD